MKIEHKLSPAMVEYVQRTIQTLNDQRKEYLMALGTAKEIEMATIAERASLEKQLQVIIDTERLPQSVTPYRLNQEGTALVGEVADPAAEILEPEIMPQRVNGTVVAETQHVRG